jgi:hypothetical protein
MHSRTLFAVALLVAARAVSSSAQQPGNRSCSPSASIGASLLQMRPGGAYAQNAGLAYGAVVGGAIGPACAQFVRLRASLGGAQTGARTSHTPLPSSGDATVTLLTTSMLYFGDLGLEAAGPRTTLQPYAAAGAGFVAFSTSTRLAGVTAGGAAHDGGDFVRAWYAGGGLRIRTGEHWRDVPILLDFSVMRHGSGRARYADLTRIERSGDGSIVVGSHESSIRFTSARVGIVLGQ